MAGPVEAVLRIKIDPSGAVVGARVYDQAVDQVDRRTRASSSTLKDFAKVSGQLTGGVSKLGLAAGATLLGVYALRAGIGALSHFVAAATKESESASRALSRLDVVSRNLHQVTGDALAPGLAELADAIEEVAAREDVVEMFMELGAAVGWVADQVGEETREWRELVDAWAVGIARLKGIKEAHIAMALAMQESERKQRLKDWSKPELDLEDAASKFADIRERQRKEREEAARDAERLEREREIEARRLREVVDRYDEYGAALRQLTEDEEALNKAMKEGKRPAEELRKAMAELARQRKIIEETPYRGFGDMVDLTRNATEIRLLEERGDLLDQQDRDRIERQQHLNRLLEEAQQHLEAMKGPHQVVNEQIEKYNLLLDEGLISLEKHRALVDDLKWGQALSDLRSIAEVLGRSNDRLGRMVHNVIDIAEAWKKVKVARAAGESGRGDMMAAYGQIAQSVYAIGTDAGWWGPKGGTSQFGAKKEGNYAKEGEQVGSIIGMAIGAYFAGPAGAAAGSAIGSALGGIVGSFIKKGADEGLAQLKLVAGEVGVKIQKDEGGLGSVLKGIGADIGDAIQSITAILGGELQSLPEISLKVRDDVVTVVVAGVKARFKNVDEAISFAVSEALKSAEITGLSTAMSQLLQGGRFDSVEDLQSAVQFLKTLQDAASGLSQLGLSLQNMATHTAVAVEQLERYGVAADQAASIGWGAFVNQWQAAARQVTGRGLSREEALQQKRQEVDILNAQKALGLAKIRQEIAETKARVEMAKVQAKLGHTEIEMLRKGLEGYAGYVTGRARITEAEIAMLESTLKALEQYEKALAGIADINLKDVRIGGFGGGGRGGGGEMRSIVDDWREGVKEFRQAIKDMRFDQGTTALTLREQVELAKSEYDSLFARARGGDVTALQSSPDALRRLLELYKTFTGGGQGFLGDFRDFFERYTGDAERFLDSPRPDRLRRGNAIFDPRFHEAQREQLREQRAHRLENGANLRRLISATEENARTNQAIREELRVSRKAAYDVGRVGA